ncbi:MAG: ATP-dependent helicase [Burkholderiales bacterium]|nr:ATP-dependent helicase [Burkholderiales bacterium]
MSERDCFQPSNITPSDEQVAIQMSLLPTMLVQANAGAGKTTTLALRIAQALHSGVVPAGILVLTFTDAACVAMRQALVKIGLSRATVSALKIQTFDGFSAAVLLSLEKGKVPFRKTTEDAADDVYDVLEDLGMQVDSGFVERFLAVSRKLKGTLAWDCAIWDGARVDDELAHALQLEPEFLQIFKRYENLRYPSRDGIDRPLFRCEFDATYDLARQIADPEPTTFVHEFPAWPKRLALVLVDEMHDLNLAMFKILRGLLDSTGARFCGVGDYDQVIHATAGAERRFMSKDIDLGEGRGVRVFPLTSTRRFNRPLALMAGNLAGKPYSSAADHMTAVDCASYDSSGEDGGEQLLIRKLNDWKASGQMADVAILLRHSSQSVAVENALLTGGFRYKLRGFESYVMQPEVLLVRALLAVATDDYEPLGSNETRAELVRAIVFFCDIKLGYDVSEKETRQERLDFAIRNVLAEKSNLRAFLEFQVLNKVSPKVAGRMNKAIEIARNAKPDAPWFDDFLDALEIRQWVRQVFIERQRQADALAYFDGLKRAAARAKGPKTFFAMLRDPAAKLEGVLNDNTRAQLAAIDRKKTLTIARVSDVKGLEFEHVIMPFLEHGAFPADLSKDLVEERNLFYVGMTRARSRLTLLTSAQSPSAYLLATGVQLGQ